MFSFGDEVIKGTTASCSLSWITHSAETSCHLMETGEKLRPLTHSQRGTGVSCKQRVCLEVDLPAPGKLPDDCSPGLNSGLSQSHSAKLLLNSWPLDREMICVCCFKPLNFAIICNAETDNWYSPIKPSPTGLSSTPGLRTPSLPWQVSPRSAGSRSWAGKYLPSLFLLQTGTFAPPSRVFLILAAPVVIAMAALDPCLCFGFHSNLLAEIKTSTGQIGP